ncbi:MAG: DnaD domain protein [Solobacterium sp.]|nr:DnaD domain protein [Solobacterium sp.]
MELRPKDIYRVECTDFLSEDALTSLLSLYQPVVGRNAVIFYLTLYSEGRSQHSQENHGRLSAVMNMTMDEMERARIHLEEYLLVRTYVEEGESRSSYIYRLNAPLSAKTFLSSRELTAAFAAAVGQKNAELSVSKFSVGTLNTSGYKDITRKITTRPVSRDFDPTVQYSKVQPRYNFDPDQTEINFDYEHFIATTSSLVFPVELRTQENLKLIGKLATIYGLSADRMRILVSRAVNIDSMSFDDEKLKLMAARSKPDITEAKDPYALPPVSFLQAKQNGRPVSLADKKILEKLSIEYRFSNEVINVMIEYILKISDNKLVAAFVEMIAGEWARKDIQTREQAVSETKKKNAKSSGRRREVLPEYYGRKDNEEETADSEELEKAQALLRKMGNLNG